MGRLGRITWKLPQLDPLRQLECFGKKVMPENSRLVDVDHFGANPGNLHMRKYVPKGLDHSAPLVVVLHGCTQTAASFDRGTGWSALADAFGFALLFPEQKRQNNMNNCFTWFNNADTRRGEGEAASIRSMIARMALQHRIDENRVFITGLSAGGAMTAVMLATYRKCLQLARSSLDCFTGRQRIWRPPLRAWPAAQTATPKSWVVWFVARHRIKEPGRGFRCGMGVPIQPLSPPMRKQT